MIGAKVYRRINKKTHRRKFVKLTKHKAILAVATLLAGVVLTSVLSNKTASAKQYTSTEGSTTMKYNIEKIVVEKPLAVRVYITDVQGTQISGSPWNFLRGDAQDDEFTLFGTNDDYDPVEREDVHNDVGLCHVIKSRWSGTIPPTRIYEKQYPNLKIRSGADSTLKASDFEELELMLMPKGQSSQGQCVKTVAKDISGLVEVTDRAEADFRLPDNGTNTIKENYGDRTFSLMEGEKLVIDGEEVESSNKKFVENGGGDCPSVIVLTPKQTTTKGTHPALFYDRGGSSCDELEKLIEVSVYNQLGEPDDGLGLDGGGAEVEVASCWSELSSLALVICPVLDALELFSGTAVDIIIGNEGDYDNLVIGSDITSASDSSPAFVAWKAFRDLANIGFIIVGLIIIISIITGRASSSQQYNIKKMVPRMLFAVIGVQLSFYLTSFVIEVYNSIGFGVDGIFESIFQRIGSENPVKTTPALLSGGGVASSLIVSAGGAALAMTFGVSLMAFFIAAAAMLAAALVVVVLRKAVIIALLVVSPIIVILYIMPQTESLAKRGGSMMIKMLGMFPVIVGAIKIGQLFSYVVGGADGGGAIEGTVTPGSNILASYLLPAIGSPVQPTLALNGAAGFIQTIMAAGGYVIVPPILVYMVMKNSMFGSAFGTIRGWSKKPEGWARQKKKDQYQETKAARQSKAMGKYTDHKDDAVRAAYHRSRAGGYKTSLAGRVTRVVANKASGGLIPKQSKAQETDDRKFEYEEEQATAKDANETFVNVERERAAGRNPDDLLNELKDSGPGGNITASQAQLRGYFKHFVGMGDEQQVSNIIDTLRDSGDNARADELIQQNYAELSSTMFHVAKTAGKGLRTNQSHEAVSNIPAEKLASQKSPSIDRAIGKWNSATRHFDGDGFANNDERRRFSSQVDVLLNNTNLRAKVAAEDIEKLENWIALYPP